MVCIQTIELQCLAKASWGATGEAESEKSGKRKKCVLMKFAWWCPDPGTDSGSGIDFLTEERQIKFVSAAVSVNKLWV